MSNKQVVVVTDRLGRFVAAYVVDHGMTVEEALAWCQPAATDSWQVVDADEARRLVSTLTWVDEGADDE